MKSDQRRWKIMENDMSMMKEDENCTTARKEGVDLQGAHAASCTLPRPASRSKMTENTHASVMSKDDHNEMA